MPVSLAGFDPAIAAVLQDNTLERVFRDAMFPRLMFRMDATPERWDANVGEVKLMTRTGLIPVAITALIPGTDPTPSTYAVEQWSAQAAQYGNAIDTHMPSSRAALASKLLRDTKQLGLNAGQTLNQISRNRLFRAYCSGNSAAVAVAAIGANQVRVASLNGFTESLVNGVVTPVSAAAPLTITFGGTEPNRNVIAATPDDPSAPFGPGTLTLSAVLTVGVAAREAVVASNAPRIYRVGGGATVDAINAADVLTLDDVINAVAFLRGDNVPNHDDGYFHHHLGTQAEAQLFGDNHWQRLHESLPDSAAYREFSVGRAVGCNHYRNTECPDSLNSGTLVSSGAAAAECSPDVGAEMINNNGIRIGRTIITGMASLYECYIPEADYITEAGVTGRIGNFSVVNNGVQVMTERIRYTMRAPLDRLQQIVGQAWSWSGDFAIPSDEVTTGRRYGRAIVIEHAIG